MIRLATDEADEEPGTKDETEDVTVENRLGGRPPLGFVGLFVGLIVFVLFVLWFVCETITRP